MFMSSFTQFAVLIVDLGRVLQSFHVAK